ncbi:hypothetical protein F5Y18DRAFT_83300 [Xylariaceae sp. FL1019]|nr:hypothetical protein F5Y18DRAFT_83300 [Xylariaceae sp. FL1019]
MNMTGSFQPLTLFPTCRALSLIHTYTPTHPLKRKNTDTVHHQSMIERPDYLLSHPAPTTSSGKIRNRGLSDQSCLIEPHTYGLMRNPPPRSVEQREGKRRSIPRSPTSTTRGFRSSPRRNLGHSGAPMT